MPTTEHTWDRSILSAQVVQLGLHVGVPLGVLSPNWAALSSLKEGWSILWVYVQEWYRWMWRETWEPIPYLVTKPRHYCGCQQALADKSLK